MSFTTPVRAAIDSLRYPDALFSMSAAEAKRILAAHSTTDFGDDLDAWEQWARREGLWQIQPASAKNRD